MTTKTIINLNKSADAKQWLKDNGQKYIIDWMWHYTDGYSGADGLLFTIKSDEIAVLFRLKFL